MRTNNDSGNENPLKNLTPDQFMALGGNTVVYVRHVSGARLGEILPDADYDTEDEFHIVVGADGSPLMVADDEEVLIDWLSSRDLGVVTVH